MWMLSGLSILVLGACGEPTTGPVAPLDPGPEDLSLSLPGVIPRSATVDLGVVSDTVRPSGPATTDEWSIRDDARATIFSAATFVGFDPGYAWARGDQTYSGNHGSVKTTARLSSGGMILGTQEALREAYNPFLIDFGRSKELSAVAHIYTDATCDLTIQGESMHGAWWEFYQGTGVNTWGKVGRSSQAWPESQPPCQTAPPPGRDVYQAANGGSVTCYFMVTYDRRTGEVFSADLLYCDSGGGDTYF